MRYYLIFIIVLILSSCKTQSVLEKNVKSIEASITEEKKFEFRQNFFDANCSVIKGENDEAINYLSNCLRIDPTSGAAYYKLASVYLNKNDFINAEKYAVKAVEFENNNTWYLYLAGSLYAQNKKFTEAINTFESLIKLNSSEIDLYMKLADIYLIQNDLENAIRVYNLTEKKFGITESISLQKYKLFLSLKKNSDAQKELVKLSKISDQNPIYERMMAEYFIMIGEIDNAINKFSEIIRQNGEDGYSHIGLAECYQLKGDYKKSIEEIKIAFSLDDVSSDDKVDLLINFIKNVGDNKEAKVTSYELTEILIKKYPENPDLNTIYANLLIQNGLYTDARIYLQNVLKVRKDKYEIWEQLVLIENELLDWTAMYEETKEALTYFPNQSFIYFFNGFSAFQLGKYVESQSSFEFGYKLITKNDPLRKDYLSFLAEVYYKNNLKQKSFETFDLFLEIEPNNIMVLNNYAYYLSLEQINLEKAKAMSYKTVQKEPKNPTYLDTYAWVLFKMKNYSESITYILQAVELDNYKSDVLLEHLGDVYFYLGEVDKAVYYWETALKIGKGSGKINEKILRKEYME